MSGKVAVIYKSKTGFVKKYAQWIAEALKGDLIENKTLTVEKLKAYDTIIYGGGVYAGQINGAKLILDHCEELKGKHLILFASGASSPDTADAQGLFEKGLTEAQRKAVKTFYLRGGFDFNKLGVGSKIMMTLFKSVLKKQSDTSEAAREMLEAYEHPTDFTSLENTKPLVRYVQSLSR